MVLTMQGFVLPSAMGMKKAVELLPGGFSNCLISLLSDR
jgi:hypothetical protein